MRIVHVITGLDNGGAEGALYRLATSDIKNSHRVITLMDEGVYGERLKSDGIGVNALRMPRGRITMRGLVELYRLVRSTKPDVVQTWMYHADLVGGVTARLAGARVVIWGIRGSFDRQRTSLSTRLTIRLCALLSRWIPRTIVSNSKHALDLHRQAGYSTAKLVHIPNGYAVEQFRPTEHARAEVRSELGLRHDDVVIGMVARFDRDKDHENLFGALSRVVENQPSITCLLIGPGMVLANAHLVDLLHAYGLAGTVRLVGSRSDMPRVMSALDLHVLSSAAESFPNVLAEAMACGTPCVATAVGDAAAIIGDTGWVVPPSDPTALSAAVLAALHLLGDRDKWNRRKAVCRQRILEHYRLERMVDAYNTLWGDAVSASEAERVCRE